MGFRGRLPFLATAWLFLVCSSLFGSTYNFQITYSGSCQLDQKALLKKLSQEGCLTVHRAHYLLEHYPNNVRYYFRNSSFFKVLLANFDYYKSRIKTRYQACIDGRMRYKCVGLCATENERDAYVLYNLLGMPGWTVHFCDEFFTAQKHWQSQVVLHEWGRLEGLGKEEGDIKENVYLWDDFLETLGREETYRKIMGLNLFFHLD